MRKRPARDNQIWHNRHVQQLPAKPALVAEMLNQGSPLAEVLMLHPRAESI